jgi:outer membrane protein TolC
VRKNFLQASEERAKIAQAQYSNGLISFDNWTIIEDDLVQAQKSFLDAQANAFLTEAQWIQAQGGTLDYVE